MGFLDSSGGGENLSGGGSIGGALTITADNANAFLVETTGTVGVFNVDTIANQVELFDDTALVFGTGVDAKIVYNTAQTVNTLFLGVSAESNGFVIAEVGDIAFDFSHGLQTNPTLFIHSKTQATDEWISFSHNTLQGGISTGKGALSLGNQNTTHSLSGNGDLIVNKFESNNLAFFDGQASFASTVTFSGVGTVTVSDEKIFYIGSSTSNRVRHEWSTSQTVDTYMIGLGIASRSIIFMDDTGLSTMPNMGFPAQDNATIVLQGSDETQVDERMWLTYNATLNQGEIHTGVGDIFLNPVGKVIVDDIESTNGQNLNIGLDPAATAGFIQLNLRADDEDYVWLSGYQPGIAFYNTSTVSLGGVMRFWDSAAIGYSVGTDWWSTGLSNYWFYNNTNLNTPAFFGDNNDVGLGTVVIDTTPSDLITSASLFIDATNENVGIGTITPAAKLHVNGDFKLGATTVVNSVIDDDTMATASATALATSESIKAYTDSRAPLPAYSSLWYHNGESTTTISTQNIYTQITSFVNVGDEDADGNLVGDAVTDNDLVVGANGAGVYKISIQASFRNGGGGTSDMVVSPGITLATPIAISSSTDATPIVVTTTGAHGLKTGDSIRIAGHATNVAANTDASITVTDSTHFSLDDLSHVNIAGSGAGAGSGGNVTIVFPGSATFHRKVSQTDLGRGAASGSFRLEASDILEMYVANQDGTDNFISVQETIVAHRIDT